VKQEILRLLREREVHCTRQRYVVME